MARGIYVFCRCTMFRTDESNNLSFDTLKTGDPKSSDKQIETQVAHRHSMTGKTKKITPFHSDSLVTLLIEAPESKINL